MKILSEINYGLRGIVKVSVVEKGRVVREYPQDHNLILNQGLNQLATNYFHAVFSVAVAGTGTTPTEIDGGSETCTIVGGAVTLTNVGFLAGDSSDVGRSIKLTGSGNVYTITAAGDTTHCTVTPATSEGPDNFFVYNTNQSGLTAEVKRTFTYLTGAPNCQTVTSGNVTVLTRTFDFSAEVGNITYNEVGFSTTTNVGSNLFSRIKLAAGVPLTAGQQLRVLYSLQITVSPTTPQTYGASPIVGWPTATGTLQNNLIPIGFVSTSGNGLTVQGTPLGQNPVDLLWYIAADPGGTGLQLAISADSTAHLSYGSNALIATSNPAGQTSGNSSYVSGSYTIDHFTTFPVGSANRTDWRSFFLGVFNSGTVYWIGPRFLFDSAQTKLSTFTLTLGFRMTWNRVL